MDLMIKTGCLKAMTTREPLRIKSITEAYHNHITTISQPLNNACDMFLFWF